jgi:hypothetical protein
VDGHRTQRQTAPASTTVHVVLSSTPIIRFVWTSVAPTRSVGPLRQQRDAVVERTADGLPAERALEWLRALGESFQTADVPKEKADLMHAIYERITVAGPEIVGVRLTAAAYAHGLALALPEKVELARPTGVGRALATYEIPIEGRDEWLAAARRLA